MTDKKPLITVNELKIHFPIGKKNMWKGEQSVVKAVDGLSFQVFPSETLGLVGESGSGKTTVGRAMLRALRLTGGAITFHIGNQDIQLANLSNSELRKFRSHIQLIFQDPYSSLNPRMTVRDIIAEPLEALGLCSSREEVDEKVRAIAERCKLNLEYLRRFPHAFSGGQRQRICIARALVCDPEFVVCDESVSALDVSIQAEILNLLQDLQDERGLSFLFIAHDLSVVSHISDRVAVMYVGRLVELATRDRLFNHPMHPYTRALMSAIPKVSKGVVFKPESLDGEIPNPAKLPSGCLFHTRCKFSQSVCEAEPPLWREAEPGHFVSCHFAEDLAEKLSAPQTQKKPKRADRKETQ